MNILVIGGSRNIGYHSALRFLDEGHTVTFLLRDTTGFDKDTRIQAALASNKAQLVRGDALVKDDVLRAWKTAAAAQDASGIVNLLLFTVGKPGTPNFSLLKGFYQTPPDLVTQCFLNALTTLPTPHPHITVITSVGITHTSHARLPMPLRPVYSSLLGAAHRDKNGVERLVAHCVGRDWNVKEDGPISPEILPGNWQATLGLPVSGSVKEILVVRPGMFTDGECQADVPGGKKYRVSDDELGGWSVSRRDVAHFIVDATLRRWSEFSGRRVNIMY